MWSPSTIPDEYGGALLSVIFTILETPDGQVPSFDVVCKHMKEVPGFEVVTLEKNHRHPIVDDILEVYKSFRG